VEVIRPLLALKLITCTVPKGQSITGCQLSAIRYQPSAQSEDVDFVPMSIGGVLRAPLLVGIRVEARRTFTMGV
jgi:hypothetical protein